MMHEQEEQVKQITMSEGTFFLQQILHMPIIYAIKSPDISFYDIGFGNPENNGEPAHFVLHIQCIFDLYWDHKIFQRFYGDMGQQEFVPIEQRLLGQCVQNAYILQGNQLMLLLDYCTMIVRTDNDDIESWRFFEYNDTHLVAAGCWLELNFPENAITCVGGRFMQERQEFKAKFVSEAEGTKFVQQALQMPVVYARKARDSDLYGIGFGTPVRDKTVAHFVLHLQCEFDVVLDQGTQQFNGDTTKEEFNPVAEMLVGQRMVEVCILQNNQLKLQLEHCTIIIRTYDDDDESWRFFDFDGNHLVAASQWLEFQSGYIERN